MKPLLFLLLLSGALFAKTGSSLGESVLRPNLHSRYALLMDIDNGRVLYHKNGYEKIYPASTTKIGTVLYLVTHFADRFDDIVEVSGDVLKSVTHAYKKEQNYQIPAYLLQFDGTNLGIKKGERLPLRMLVHAMLMISSNDAANAVAEHIGGDIPTFMEGLNRFLRSIGCENTNFNNPHGLHHPDHFSTPYDMALMGKKAAENNLFREIVLTEEYERTGTKLQKSFLFKQTNRLLKEGPYYYPYAFGLKTGHTEPGMYNLVAAAANGQRNLVVALHKSDKISGCYRDAINLFEAYFSEEMVNRLLFAKEDSLFRAMAGKISLKAELESDVSITYYPSEEPLLRSELSWKTLKLPIKKGAKVGEITVLDGERVVVKAPLLAKESIRKPFNYKWLFLLSIVPIALYIRRRSSKETSPSLSV